jgi:hypothetical protein
MKKSCFFIFSILFVTGFAFAQKYNGLSRYGLSGHVKTMQQTIFTLCKKINDKWIPTDTPYYSEKKYTYDEQGLLQSIEDRQIFTKKQKPIYTIIKIEYKDGKMKGSKWYDENNNQKGESVIKWETDSSYIDMINDEKNDMKVETYHIVDNMGRNKKTIMKKYINKNIDAFVTSNFIYTNNMLTGEVVNDSTRGYVINYNIEALEKDPIDNITQSVMFISPYKEDVPAILTYSKYEYYIK